MEKSSGEDEAEGPLEGDLAVSAAPKAARQLTAAGEPAGYHTKRKIPVQRQTEVKRKTEKKKSYQPLSTTALPHRRFFYDYVLYMAKLMIDADKKIVSSVFFFSYFFNHSSHFLALANSVFLCFLFFKCCIPIRIDGKVVSSAFLCFLINILVCRMPER